MAGTNQTAQPRYDDPFNILKKVVISAETKRIRWFRGHADSKWRLTPKAYRTECGSPLDTFDAWIRRAIAYTQLPENVFEQMAIAQHHGLSTPLLDWTGNPLVALYFAVEQMPEKDAMLYAIEPHESSFVGPHHRLSRGSSRLVSGPPEFSAWESGFFAYIPRAISPRIIRQAGRFTFHTLDRKTIENPCDRIIIPRKSKQGVRRLLDTLGVNREALFPDLDGLAAYLNQREDLSGI